MRLTLFNYFTVIALLILFTACGKSSNTKKLELREMQLENKEQELRMLEQQLALREQALTLRERSFDSLNNAVDTIGIYNPLIVGSWKVTMECIETTCEGSAIGDTKTEQWNISYQNNRVVSRVVVDGKIARTYTGFYRENTLELSALQTPDPQTHMNVVLTVNPSVAKVMEGQRIIIQSGKCKIVYRLKAEKI